LPPDPVTTNDGQFDAEVPIYRAECDIVADMQKLVGGIPDGVGGANTSHDHDRDKYKRRPAVQWLTRWFR